MTSKQLRAAELRHRTRALEILREAEAAYAKAKRESMLEMDLAEQHAHAAEREEAAERDHRQQPLTNPHGAVKVNHTMHTESAIRGQRLKTSHPAPVTFRRVDGSVEAFARKHYNNKATTVRSWYAKGLAARDIPEPMKKMLAKKPYEIPESAWTPASVRQKL